jgi:hypothetical protein
MTRWTTLHELNNPAQTVEVDADSVCAVVGYGTGSSLQLAAGGVVAVHETPTEVRKILWGQGAD